MKSIQRLSVFCVVLMFGIFFPNNWASATSAYDSYYRTTAALYMSPTLYTSPQCDHTDLTVNWRSYLTDSSRFYGSNAAFNTMKGSFESALSSGDWAVSTTGSEAIVWWTEDHSMYLEWDSGSISVYPRSSSTLYATTIACNGSTNNGLYSSWGRGVVDQVNSPHWNPLAGQNGSFLNYLYTGSVNYPSDYEGQLIRSIEPSLAYVAIGDSFSSGEGNPRFEAGTDVNSANECHRSPQAYPRLLQNELNTPMAFVACSGATTNDVLYGDSGAGSWGEGPQIDALSGSTEVVTITIGGNDVGFGDFATQCLFPFDTYVGVEGSCDEFTPIYEDTVYSITHDLQGKLEGVYSAILDKAPNAIIYVIGYPLIAPNKGISDPFDQDCGGLYDAWPNTWGDARAAYEVVNLLNSTIENAVDATNLTEGSTQLTYVDVSQGTFLNHDVCSSDSYFNGIFWPNNQEYSIHPNSNGHIAYSQDIEEAMN